MTDKTAYINGQKQIDLEKDNLVRFNTYFDGLSVEKWRKYTRVKHILAEEIVESEVSSDVMSRFPGGEKGSLSFQIQPLEDF